MSAMAWDHDPHRVPDAMAEGIAARALGLAPNDRARPFYATTFVQLAYACLVGAGADPPGLSPTKNPGRVIELGLTSSDLPFVLGNVFDKMLVEFYGNLSPTFARIAARKLLTDFRPTKIVTPDAFPVPLQVGELAEVKEGAIRESAQTMTLSSFARIASVGFQALVNDDLGAFAELAQAAALRCVDFQNALFFQTVLAPNSGLGPTLADGQPLFHSTHANVGSAGVLSSTTLAEGRALLKKQTTPGGVSLNSEAAHLLVAPDYQQAAEELAAKAAPGAAPGRRLEVLADSSLTGARWYLLAASRQSLVYAYLKGAEGPRSVSEGDWKSGGLRVRVALDFAAGVADHRFVVSGPGA